MGDIGTLKKKKQTNKNKTKQNNIFFRAPADLFSTDQLLPFAPPHPPTPTPTPSSSPCPPPHSRLTLPSPKWKGLPCDGWSAPPDQAVYKAFATSPPPPPPPPPPQTQDKQCSDHVLSLSWRSILKKKLKEYRRL